MIQLLDLVPGTVQVQLVLKVQSVIPTEMNGDTMNALILVHYVIKELHVIGQLAMMILDFWNMSKNLSCLNGVLIWIICTGLEYPMVACLVGM